MFKASNNKPKNVSELNKWIQRQGEGDRYCIMDRFCTPESTAENCTEFFIMVNNNGVWNTFLILQSIDDVINYFDGEIYGIEVAIIKRDWAD